MKKTYVPLHMHSIFSIRDAISKIDELVEKAVKLQLPAMALTDHGTLSGILQFYQECKKNNIKPILGCEVYVATRGRNDKVRGIDKYYHLVLLAMNMEGWSNLTQLVSQGYYANNHYYKPRIDRELLRKYNKGLICLSACWGGHLPQSIFRLASIETGFDEDMISDTIPNISCSGSDNGCNCLECNPSNYFETPDQVIQWHKNVFGDRYYIELQSHNTEIEVPLNKAMLDLSNKHGVKVIVTTDSHFVEAEDKKAHNLLLAIRGNITVNDEKMQKLSYPGDGYHLLSYEELYSRFEGHANFLENTLEIAERCNVDFHLGDFKLPHVVPVKQEDKIFRDRVFKGLKIKYGENIPDKIINRAEEEIQVITQMCFSSYFLMISDFIRWAKKNNIPIGPGRGSAAGAIVAYALDITDVDSLEYDLSFARFLNKGRCSIPVVDFPELPFNQWKQKTAS